MGTLLLTACINPGATPFVKINNVNERLQSYLGSLEKWISESTFDSIVFCENSGYEYDYGSLMEKAVANGKKLEVLVFSGNEGSYIRGKGYGEGEILKHALDNSILLKDAHTFFKCTGRLFVRNINRLLHGNSKRENVFQRSWWSHRAVDTRFFKSGVQFFRDDLMDAYLEVDDRANRFIEYVYLDKLRGKHLPVFSEFPDIIGICATTKAPYTLTKFRLAKKNVLLKIGYFNIF